MREESDVPCECPELRSSSSSWSRSRSMLSELDASWSGNSGLVSSSTGRYLKLVIGSVGIEDENRIIAHFGLKIINQQPRIGLKKLIEVSINKEELSIGDLVFYLGPRINAAGRMGDAKNSVKMLIADTDEMANEFAKELETQNASSHFESLVPWQIRWPFHLYLLLTSLLNFSHLPFYQQHLF